jgi:hypothetical protein
MNIAEVEQLEERLRMAMLTSDVAELDALVSDRLLFVTPDGTNVNKAIDLEAHRSGVIRFTTLTPAERHIENYGPMAVVNVEMVLAGDLAGQAIGGRFRYTRIWHFENGRAQVVAGHVCEIK